MALQPSLPDSAYLPGLCGLEWQHDPATGEYTAEAEQDFVSLFFDWKRNLTAIGYSLVKVEGRWTARFAVGMVDKPEILATLLRIREHQLQKLGGRP